MDSEERERQRRSPGARRRARELALAALYRADVLGLDDAAALSGMPEIVAIAVEDWSQRDRRGSHIRDEAVEYATLLVTGVLGARDDLDAQIGALAIDWSVQRQAVTDRTILRIALWELARCEDPPAAIVNEAVEIAQDYGGLESSKFVNGILGAKLRDE